MRVVKIYFRRWYETIIIIPCTTANKTKLHFKQNLLKYATRLIHKFNCWHNHKNMFKNIYQIKNINQALARIIRHYFSYFLSVKPKRLYALVCMYYVHQKLQISLKSHEIL